MTPELWRLTIFCSVLVGFTLAEQFFMARKREPHRLTRLGANGGILLVGTALINLIGTLFPVGLAIGAAHWASQNNFGLFHYIEINPGLIFLVSIIFLDLAIWLQHVLTHKIPFLWRFHAVHHADEFMDTSTALRFHPIELAISSLYKSVFVVVSGIPIMAVLVFEILLNAFAIFTHANIRVAPKVDKWLQKFFVTPAMHLIHHSDATQHTNRNFGFCLSIWDKMLGTYAQVGTEENRVRAIGLGDGYSKKTLKLGDVLIFPWRQFKS